MKTPFFPRPLLIVFLYVISFSTHAQMRRIYLDGSGMDNDLRKISMINAAEGYYAFNLGAGFSGDSGRSVVYRDVLNGNVDYNGYNVNLTFGFQVSGVQAFSRDSFLLYGNFGQNPAILFSENMGGSYTLIYQGTANTTHLTRGIEDMVFPNNTRTGFAVEADRIIKTTDRGKTWFASYASTGSFFNHIEALSDNILFAFNTDGWTNKMVMTTDGGAHWKNVNLPSTQKINYASFITANKGWFSAAENQSLYYTTDGGSSWTLKNNPVILPFFCTKLHFVDDSTGYATADQYQIYKTTDSGKTWEVLPRDNAFSHLNNTHTEMAFGNNGQFWAGGGQGFIEMTTNGGGIPKPRAIFTADTNGLSATGKVSLINYGKSGYQYAWYKNDSLIGSSFNCVYTHGTYDQFDTIKLVVTKAMYADSSAIELYFNVPPRPIPASFDYFKPDSGSTGTIISVVGNHFNDATDILFGGVSAQSFKIINDTLIRAVVNGGASGVVSIVTPLTTVTHSGFRYFTPLKISGFTPASGPVGTLITIQGAQFSPLTAENIVYVGGIRVPVISSSPAALTVNAPAGTYYHEISVTVKGLTAVSNIPFIVTYPGGAPLTKNSFPSRSTFDYTYSDPHIVAGDLDGDGKTDLILGQCASYNWLSILKNNSVSDSASFTVVPTSARPLGMGRDGSVAIADMDGDGRPDIIGGDNFNMDGGALCVYRNTSTPGNIRFATVFTIASSAPFQLSVCDLDGDGKPEIFGPTGYGLTIYQNTSHDSTLSFVHYTGPDIPALNGLSTYSDVDGDGKMDILISTTSGIYVYRNISNKGAIQFERYPTLSPMPTASIGRPALMMGDLDGDGRSDVIVRTGGNDAAFALNNSSNGTLSFGTPFPMPAPFSMNGFAVGDLNGDGKSDLSLSSKTAMVFQNNSETGNPGFGNVINVKTDSIPDNLVDVAHVDVNGDGKMDIVTMNSGPGYGNTISVFLNQNPDAITLCPGSDTVLLANTRGAVYQWQINRDTVFINLADDNHFSGSNASTLSIKNMDTSFNQVLLRCVVDGNNNKATMLLVPAISTSAVTIATTDTLACSGSTVHFSSSVVHAGLHPGYQWQINGVNTGVSSPSLDVDTLKDQDSVRLILKPDLTCGVGDSTVSNVVIVHMGITQTPAIAIASADTLICAGSVARFTSLATNPGNHPLYQWRVNGIDAGTDSSVFTTTSLTDGSTISLILRPNLSCSTVPVVTSNIVTVRVNPAFTPIVMLTQTSAGNACTGGALSFAASGQIGNPQSSYQWMKNGLPVGQNSAVYTDSSAQNNDQLYVIFYPNNVCALRDSAISTTFGISTQQPVPPTVFISGTTSLPAGSTTAITAAVTNAGAQSAYQWQDSTSTNDWQDISGEVQNSIQYKPQHTGDLIRCLYGSSDICGISSNITSNLLAFTLIPTDTATIPPIVIDSGAANIRFYPNPVHSVLNIDNLKLSDQWQTLSIVKLNGGVVLSMDIRGLTSIQIPVDKLVNGLYFVSLRTDGIDWTVGRKKASFKFFKR